MGGGVGRGELLLWRGALSIDGELARVRMLVFGTGRLGTFEGVGAHLVCCDVAFGRPDLLSLVAALIAIELWLVVCLWKRLLIITQLLLLLLLCLLDLLLRGRLTRHGNVLLLLLLLLIRVAHLNWVELLLGLSVIISNFWLTSTVLHMLEVLLGLPWFEHQRRLVLTLLLLLLILIGSLALRCQSSAIWLSLVSYCLLVLSRSLRVCTTLHDELTTGGGLIR